MGLKSGVVETCNGDANGIRFYQRAIGPIHFATMGFNPWPPDALKIRVP